MKCIICGLDFQEDWRKKYNRKSDLVVCSRGCSDKKGSIKRGEEQIKLRPSFDLGSEAFAYWLGLFCADGCIVAGKRIHLAQSGPEGYNLMKWVVENVYYLDPSHIKRVETGFKPSYSIQFTNIELSTYLKSVGITERKSLTLSFDFSILKTRERKLAFIRGYCDGDGSVNIVSNKYLRWEIIGTEQVVKGIQEILQEETQVRLFPHIKTGYWYLVSQNRDTSEFAKEIFGSSHLFLSSKGERVFEYIQKLRPFIRLRVRGSKYEEAQSSGRSICL